MYKISFLYKALESVTVILEGIYLAKWFQTNWQTFIWLKNFWTFDVVPVHVCILYETSSRLRHIMVVFQLDTSIFDGLIMAEWFGRWAAEGVFEILSRARVRNWDPNIVKHFARKLMSRPYKMIPICQRLV